MRLKLLLALLMIGSSQNAFGTCVITGADSLCKRGTTTLSCSCSGGRWFISPSSIATIDSTTGVVTGVDTGAAIVSYISGSYTYTRPIRVVGVPVIAPITGSAAHVCDGSTFTLHDATGGGIWGCQTSAVATITSLGAVTALRYGTTTIYYSDSNICGRDSTRLVLSVDSNFAYIDAYPTVGGYCDYDDTLPTTRIVRHLTGYPAGGVWLSRNTAAVTVDASGNLYPVSTHDTRSSVITYISTNACGTDSASLTETVGPSAPFANISGQRFMCPGTGWTFYDNISYGGWSVSDTTLMTINHLSGSLTTNPSITSMSMDTVIYSGTDACGTPFRATYLVTIGVPSGISPDTSRLCVGGEVNLTPVPHAYFGGTWSSSSPAAAPVNIYGQVVTHGATTATIHYTCGIPGTFYTSDSAVVIVASRPFVDSITAAVSPLVFCTGSLYTLHCATAGGIWTSSSHLYNYIDSMTGLMVPGTPGGYTIYYTVPGSTGGSCPGVSSLEITVAHAPDAGSISGPSTLCIGNTTALTLSHADPGGTWSSNNPGTATIDGSGHVTALAAGTVVITYRVPSTYCDTATATYTVIVLPYLNAGTITGPTSVCYGSAIALATTGTGGGSWVSSDNSVAAVDSSGIVTAVSTGTAIIYYTVYNLCGSSTAADTITVNPLPAPITGVSELCMGLVDTLSDTTAGGTWATTSSAITIDPTTGIVATVSAGTATVSYVLPTGCYDTFTVSVDTLPVIVTAPFALVACGHKIHVSATGADSFTWSPGTMFVDTLGLPDSVGATVFANYVPTDTTFTVVGVNSFGCVGYGSQRVVIPTCDVCNPALTPIYALSGIVGTAGATFNMPAAQYYVYGNTYINGAVNLNGGVVAVGPGLSIEVEPQSNFNIVGSHFYCCDTGQLWQGFVLASFTGYNTGGISLTGNSLVEDAQTAVKIPNAVMPDTGLILVSDGTIFNRNNVGIDIDTFPGAGSLPVPPPIVYPFEIRNSVFTTRDMRIYRDSFSLLAYPYAWPATYGTTTAMKAPFSSGYMLPPFNILNTTGGAGYGLGYVSRNCNGGSLANMGIRLIRVGEYTEMGAPPNCPAVFSGIVVGDSTTDSVGALNIFDTLLVGINAIYSNFTCFNNWFMFTHQPPAGYVVPNPTGNGIAALCPPVGGGAPDYAKYAMSVRGSRIFVPPASYNAGGNSFYSCENALVSRGYYYVNIWNADFISEAITTVPHITYGSYIISPRYYDINLSHNYFGGIGTGISMNTNLLGGGAAVPQFSGNLNLNSNQFYGGKIGITVNKTIGSGSAVLPGAIAHVDTNSMEMMQNGIAVNGYTNQSITSDTNYVELIGPPAGGALPGWEYGIYHTNCINNYIRNNVVLGQAAPMPSFAAYLATPVEVGIYGTLNLNATVSCNIAANLSTAFQFLGPGNITIWKDNVLENSKLGLVLQNNFGNQGSPTVPSNNVWRGVAFWTSGVNKTILTLNSAAPPDNIYVNPWTTGADIFDPAHNDNFPHVPGWTYGGSTSSGSGNGLYVISSSIDYVPCEHRTPLNTSYYRVAHSENSQDTVWENQITNPGDSSAATNWIQQNNLYRMLLADSTIGQNSKIINQFKKMASASRFGWLADIEKAVSVGDTSTATSLSNQSIYHNIDSSVDTATGVALADGTATDYIVKNYVTFYKKYLAYTNAKMNANDSLKILAIANLCPQLNGNVVLEARTLYKILYQDDTTVFKDTCMIDTSGFASRFYHQSTIPKQSQQLSL